MLLCNLGGGPGSETGGIWIKINMRDLCQAPEDLSTRAQDIGPGCLTGPWEIPFLCLLHFCAKSSFLESGFYRPNENKTMSCSHAKMGVSML